VGGLVIADGRMTVDDGTQRRFDTDDGYFHILGALSGSQFFPARDVLVNFNNTVDSINTTTDYNLGAVPDACDAILGSIRCTYSGGAVGGLTNVAYFSIFGGGTYVHVFDGYRSREGRSVSGNQCVFYTFTIEGPAGGRFVNMRERFFIRLDDPSIPSGSSVIYGVDGFTMNWRLRVGRFT
jgi:hypothetical protein